MKNKIMVFALLLSLVLAVLVPVQVKAANSTETTSDDVKYKNVVDFLESRGYTGFVLDDSYKYIVIDEGDIVVLCIKISDNNIPFFGLTNTNKIVFFANSGDTSLSRPEYYFYSAENAAIKNCYTYYKDFPENEYVRVSYNSRFTYYGAVAIESIDKVLYSDLSIYDVSSVTDNLYFSDYSNLIFESSLEGEFDFPVWCAYAGLNCIASSNESPTMIPYSYNDYWHIVRKTSSGKWLLTTIGNSKNQKDMQLRISEDNSRLIIFNVYQDDGTDSSNNGYYANVRQYEYDTDGWKVLTYDSYDIRDFDGDIIDLEVGTAFDDTRILAYTNTDIYSYNGYAVMHEASTEYFDVTDTVFPTPEPTTTPDSGGSGSSGGGRPGSGSRPEVDDTGGLGFIVDLFTMIWDKICSIPLSVDGYRITLQQIAVYSLLVTIVGGFILRFIFKGR